MGRFRSKAKGDKFEREVAEYIATRTGLPARRAPMSGSGGFTHLGDRRDLLGTPGFYIDCKRHERLEYKRHIFDVWNEHAAAKTDDIPAVITRRNQMETSDSLVIMRLSDFVDIYKRLLQQVPNLLGGPVADGGPEVDSGLRDAGVAKQDGNLVNGDIDLGQSGSERAAKIA